MAGKSRFRMTHVLHDRVDLEYDGRPLFRYVYEPDLEARLSPKPFFHPLWTLAGNEVTAIRPHDHPWHHGLAMTMAQLSGQNFWGGPTYVHGSGYVWLEDHGRIAHRAWEELRCDADGALLDERLAWVSHTGDDWIDERRRVEVREVDLEGACWRLDLEFRLRNVREEPLAFGSPTTKGRPSAGYGGLFWRGIRSFQGGTILAGGGLEGPEVMGKAAPWLAFVGRHDGGDDRSTLLFLDRPGNPRYPNQWFVRNESFPGASFAFMFDEEYTLDPGQELTLDYATVLANGGWTRREIEAYLDR
jgi:Methane oxygenase PmoA